MSTLTLLAAAPPAANNSVELKSAAIALSVFALALGFVQWKRKKTPKITGWLMLIAGAGIAGATGLAGDFLRKLGELLGTALSSGTSAAFGVAVPGALAGAVFLWLCHDLWPSKKAKASKALPWLALAFPTLLAIAGGVWAGLNNELMNSLGDTTANVATAFVTAW